MILRIRIFVNRKILILKIFLRKMTILRKILRIRLILGIRIFVNTDADVILHALDNVEKDDDKNIYVKNMLRNLFIIKLLI